MKNNIKNRFYHFIFIILFIMVWTNIFVLNTNAKNTDESIKKEINLNTNVNNVSTYSSDYDSSTLQVDSVGINNFTDVKYISNADYFKVNPYHAINDGSDNEIGTCTTVAMQMLMGYHNYYTDRRLIPNVGGNGLRYLSNDYGELIDNPKINNSISLDYGRTSIGTEVGFYEELMDLNDSSEEELGQMIGKVKDAAILFVNKYASDIKDDVLITSGIFSKSTAKSDIESGNPIILGTQPVFTGANSFHVVVAYGYAVYNGVEGFIVHCGW